MGHSLVYHAGALGDFLTTLPAMRAWRRLHRQDRIVLLGVPAHGALAPAGTFNEVWDARSSRFAALYADGGGELAGVRFQSALLFSGASSRLPQNLSCIGVKEILRQDPFPSSKIPVIDYHLSLFPDLDFTDEDRLPTIARVPGTLAVPPNAVALHPGSGDRRKNWPLPRFTALAAELERAGFPVQWIVGPAEEHLALPAGASAWSNAPLADLAAALASCRLFVGNDCGISHLAAAAGCPTVALFGATDPEVWAPRGRSVRVLQAPGGALVSLSVEMTLSACRSFLRG